MLGWWADNGPPGKYVALVQIGGHFRKFRRKLGWWDRRLKPYPGVVCNGFLDSLDVVVLK